MPDRTAASSATDSTTPSTSDDADPRERRGSPRRKGSDGDIRSPTLGVRILNLSAAGLAIETDRALRVGGRYRFTLASSGSEARIDGRVLWCRLSGTRRLDNGDVRPVYRAGIERIG